MEGRIKRGAGQKEGESDEGPVGQATIPGARRLPEARNRAILRATDLHQGPKRQTRREMRREDNRLVRRCGPDDPRCSRVTGSGNARPGRTACAAAISTNELEASGRDVSIVGGTPDRLHRAAMAQVLAQILKPE